MTSIFVASGTLYQRQYYDQSGTATKFVFDVQQPVGAGSTVSNSVTGFSLPIGVHQLFTFTDFDPSTGFFQEETVAGQFVLSTLPTVGLVFNQSGHIAFPLPGGITQASQLSHLLRLQEALMEIQAICSALS